MGLKKELSALALLSLLCSMEVHAKVEIFKGKVVGVSDGDTISVKVDGFVRKVRLNGIDCPEKTQAYGQQAKIYTSKRAFSKTVKIISNGQDRYKRTIGEVILPNGMNLNELLLQNGYAWWYRQFSKDSRKHELEDSARKHKRGIWKDSHAVPPWDFRKKR